jgi:tripartite-type tricarboxylate transporter receptor subunit TctC
MMLRRGVIALLMTLVGVRVMLPLAVNAGGDNTFKGRTVIIYVSTGPGGGYDAYARLVARNLGRHLPGNPNVIVESMPGAGGLNLANYLYNVAPKDGSAIGTMQHTITYEALFGDQAVKFDARKFNWIGSIATFTSVGVAWHTSGVKTIEDAKKKQIAMGASGAGATSFEYTNLMNHLLGTKFKILIGYKGSTAMYLAMERGELQGVAGTDWAVIRNDHSDWIKTKDIDVFVQFALKKSPDLPNVPLIGDLASSAEDKRVLHFVFAGLQFARPFLAPPGVPASVVAQLRSGFDAAAMDPALLAQAKKEQLDIEPADGATVQRLVGELYETPKPIVKRADWALTAP